MFSFTVEDREEVTILATDDFKPKTDVSREGNGRGLSDVHIKVYATGKWTLEVDGDPGTFLRGDDEDSLVHWTRFIHERMKAAAAEAEAGATA